MEWAQHYIDQLDPLCPTPHDPDMKADRPGYYSPPETKVSKLLGRLLGQSWEDAFKISKDESAETNRSGPAARVGEDDDDDDFY